MGTLRSSDLEVGKVFESDEGREMIVQVDLDFGSMQTTRPAETRGAVVVSGYEFSMPSDGKINPKDIYRASQTTSNRSEALKGQIVGLGWQGF